jgi:hypothetical protein
MHADGMETYPQFTVCSNSIYLSRNLDVFVDALNTYAPLAMRLQVPTVPGTVHRPEEQPATKDKTFNPNDTASRHTNSPYCTY